jgi:hypothetical protein
MRRLFDRELDNQHEEPMLRVQLAALQLQHWLHAMDQQDGGFQVQGASLSSWLLKSAEYLKLTAVSLQHIHTSSVENEALFQDISFSGLVHNSSIFLHLYRCLLPFWAVSPHMCAQRLKAAGLQAPECEIQLSNIKGSIAAALPGLALAVGPSSTGPVRSLLNEVTLSWAQEVDRKSLVKESDWPALFLVHSIPKLIM